MRRLANLAYLAAVLAINFTLMRPSPVDVLFITALVLSVFARQIITRNVLILAFFLLTWLTSLYVSSIQLIDNPDVVYQAQKISYAVSIGICSALVAANWDQSELVRFLKTIVLATGIAATLGIIGFVFELEDLLWDGRAKAFLDDPNMYSAFLLPGVFACMYLLSEGERRWIYLPAMILLLFGIVPGFSRAALGAVTLWGGLYYVILNRHGLPKAVFYALAAILVIVAAVLVGSLFIDGLAEKIADRSTVAKDYDLGHGGRYDRYELAIPFILDHPLGMGLLEIDRFFEEPIHNIWISSFLNYGWVAGLAFTLLIVCTVAISIHNYRVTRNQICLCVFFCWLAITSCAFLHEAERWRHLWLFTGLAWGVNARHLTTRRSGRSEPAPGLARDRASSPVASGQAAPGPASNGWAVTA